MSLQPMIKPLMDFNIQGVSVPDATTDQERVFVATVHYEHRGNTFEANIHFAFKEGELHLATQGQRIGLPMMQLLGSLLAKINGGAHVAQVH
jgi:hypothetical protein